MPRDGAGLYTLPSGNPVVTGTLIQSSWANPTMSDIAVQLNNVLTRDGILGPTLPFKLVDGTVAAPGLAFSSEPGSGMYRVGASQRAWVSANAVTMLDDASSTVDTQVSYYPRGTVNPVTAAIRLFGKQYPAVNGPVLTMKMSNSSATISTSDGTGLTTPLTLGSANIAMTGAATENLVLSMVKAASGRSNTLLGTTGALSRWGIQLGNVTAEGGANAGSDFQVDRYSDAGAYLSSPITVTRATGLVTLAATNINGAANISGTATANALAATTNLGVGTSITAAGNIQGGTMNSLGAMTSGGAFQGNTTVTALGNVVAGFTAGGYLCKAGSSGGFGGNTYNLFWNGSAMQLWVDGSNTGTINVTSDERIKKNITPLAECDFMALKPIQYRFKKQGIYTDDRLQQGFSAQNVKKVIPLAVMGDENELDADGNIQPLHVLDRPILAHTVLMLQKALTRIDALELKISQLTGA